MEGYWDDTIFYRIIKGFIIQGGDPTSTREGGKIYGEPSKNKHTIFGKVTGETINNMLKFEEALVDENDRLLYPPRLLMSIILNNPFSDIIPRIIVQENEEVKDSSETEKAAVKDFNLLSFGKQAEEDEEESAILNKNSQLAVEPPGLTNKKRKEDRSSDWEGDDEVKTAEELEVINKEKDFTPEFQNKHTIYGEVTGESIYSMLKLEEVLVDENDRPLYPPRLIKTIILNNPFSDIIPRIIVQECEEVKDSSETEKAAVKDFNLLSFDGEAKEDEEESAILNKRFTGKGKSAHDHLTDPQLSSQLAVEPPGLTNKKRKEDRSSDWEGDDEVKTAEELEVINKEKEDFNLLSFGKQAEEDEEESAILNKNSQLAVEPPGLTNKKRKEDRSSDWEGDDEVKTAEELEVINKEKEAMKKRIKSTLRDTKKEPKKVEI
ncbi:Peptidyl-prolyl isomerase cwc27 [Eufriesea mexicana]|uniref:Spliceosome-associated protein CWC27 homolog n=1 Tax=Eufriesea mexicana TaxID=516756 RepID=A0A310S6X8_9HYME|nr:Peptidyl-prolyl isomerase cwc27 [Eufriesea mexicana]